MYVIVACLLLLTVPKYVSGDGKLQVKFVRYNNPSGKGNNGHCCDGRGIFCEIRGCDHYFKLCIDTYDGTNAMTSCPFGQLTTGTTNNQDTISQFGNNVGGTANPIEFRFAQWNDDGGIKFKFEVWDEDGNSDDFVDSLQTRVRVRPSPSEQQSAWQQLIVTARTSLTISVRVFCSATWYGPRCSVRCQPSEAPARYECDSDGNKRCHPGWTGSDCRLPVNRCESSPCQHGARCIDDINAYICQCLPGFTGILCETDIDECASTPCLNAGSCIANTDVTGYHCQCQVSWSGENCQVHLDTCSDLPCSNQGTCIQKSGGEFVCLCQPPWSGVNCTELSPTPDTCDTLSCFNNGVCVNDVSSGYRCLCSAQFTGEHCETDLCHADKTCKLDIRSNCEACEPASDNSTETRVQPSTVQTYSNNSKTENAFIFNGRLEDEQIERVVKAVLSWSKDLFEQRNCHQWHIEHQVEYCQTDTKIEISFLTFDFMCNNTELSWEITEEHFSQLSDDDFNQLLPLPVTEDIRCLPNTRASHVGNEHTVRPPTPWLPVVIIVVVGCLLLVALLFVVIRCRRRRLPDTRDVVKMRDCEDPLCDELVEEVERNSDSSHGQLTVDTGHVAMLHP